LSDAVDNVLELKIKVVELADENRLLREQLEQRASVRHDPQFGYFFKEGETKPLCAKCYQGPEKSLVYLNALKSATFGTGRKCPVCDQVTWETSPQQHVNHHMPRSSWE
jgi:hypothetical protein